jgi:hypothetical protein
LIAASEIDERLVSACSDFREEGLSIFDANTQNPIEMQQQGWQSILNNFKKYVETK